MKLIRIPIYLTLVLISLIYLALANHRGWSLLQTISPRSWHSPGPNTQHK